MEKKNIRDILQVKINSSKMQSLLSSINRDISKQELEIHDHKYHVEKKFQKLENQIIFLRQEIKTKDIKIDLLSQPNHTIKTQDNIHKIQIEIAQLKKNLSRLQNIEEDYKIIIHNSKSNKEHVSVKTMTINKEQSNSKQSQQSVIHNELVVADQNQTIKRKSAVKSKCERQKQKTEARSPLSLSISAQALQSTIEAQPQPPQAFEPQPQPSLPLPQVSQSPPQVRPPPKQCQRMSRNKKPTEMDRMNEMMRALQCENERRVSATLQENNRYMTLMARLEQIENTTNNQFSSLSSASRVGVRHSTKNMDMVLAMQLKSVEDVWDKKMEKLCMENSRLKDKVEMLDDQLGMVLRRVQKERGKNNEIVTQMKKIEEKKLDQRLIQSLTGLVKRTERKAEEAVEKKLEIGVFKVEKEVMHESLRYLKEAMGEKAEKEGIKKAFMFLQDKLRDIVTLLAQSHGQLLQGAINTLPLKCLSCARDIESLRRNTKTSMSHRKHTFVKQ